MNEITNPSPKARYIESGSNVSSHRKMVDQPEFTRACDFAMLQYVAGLTGSITDTGSATSVGLQILGAQQFLSVLRNLSEVPKAPTNIVTPNLNHRA